MSDHPKMAREIFGIPIHCMKCNAEMTAAAYIIETCQACGAAKQDERRRLACARYLRKQGRKLAEEVTRRADDAFIAAHGGVDLGAGSDRTVLSIAVEESTLLGGMRFRVIDDMPADIDFALLPDPIPIKTVIDDDGTERSEIDVDELRRRMAIAKTKETEDDGTDD